MSKTVILNSFFGWQGAYLCTVFERGGNFTTLIEESDVAYFPAVQKWARGEVLGWLGSAFKWLCCHGAPFHPSALWIQFFWTWRWRWTSLDQDHVDHDLCRMLGWFTRAAWKISFHTTCHRRLSEQPLDSNRGRFSRRRRRWILCIIYHYRICATSHFGST
jgi:hypothetical protein